MANETESSILNDLDEVDLHEVDLDDVSPLSSPEIAPTPLVDDWSILPVVSVGDSDGWAQHAVRWAGFTSETFTQQVADELGAEVIDDLVWADLLPIVSESSAGLEVVVLRKLLNVGAGPTWDAELAKALNDFCGASVCDTDVWRALFARALAEHG